MRVAARVYPLLAAVLAAAGCSSNGGHYEQGDYIGPGPAWYYGSHYPYGYYEDYPDYIVTPRPPGDRPERPGDGTGLKPRPEHPIANPPPDRPGRPATRPAQRPSYSTPRGRAAPSIPSRPRPMGGRRGGGRRR